MVKQAQDNSSRVKYCTSSTINVMIYNVYKYINVMTYDV